MAADSILSVLSSFHEIPVAHKSTLAVSGAWYHSTHLFQEGVKPASTFAESPQMRNLPHAGA